MNESTLKQIFGVELNQVEDDLFDYNYPLYWKASTVKQYNKIEKTINSIKYTGVGYTIYAWYDVSGYRYWVKQQEEPNYIQISIRTNDSIVDLTSLKRDLNKAIYKAKNIVK